MITRTQYTPPAQNSSFAAVAGTQMRKISRRTL